MLTLCTGFLHLLGVKDSSEQQVTRAAARQQLLQNFYWASSASSPVQVGY